MSNPAREVFRASLVVIIVLAGFSLCSESARAQITMQVFVDPHTIVSGGTIGFAYAGNKFVGSVDHDGVGALYATDLDGTNLRVFAPSVSLPVGSIDREHFVASSVGLGGFPARDVYVGASNQIFHIANDGATSDLFVSGLSTPVRGILFDLVGTFDNEMLVSTYGGQVYRVNSSGTAKLLASVGEDTEGMDIAPLGGGFGAFDGKLIVASERSGLLRAITPDGKTTILNQSNPIPWAEMVAFVPLDLGASGSPVEGLYEANWTINVLKADRAQFLMYKGDLIVTSEIGDRRISRMHWNGASFDITRVGAIPNQGEDGMFVTNAMINPEVACVSNGTRPRRGRTHAQGPALR